MHALVTERLKTALSTGRSRKRRRRLHVWHGSLLKLPIALSTGQVYTHNYVSRSNRCTRSMRPKL